MKRPEETDMENRLYLMESVVRSATSAVLIAKAVPTEPSDPRVVFVNEAYTRLTGYSPDDVLGKTHQVLIRETDRSQIETIRTALTTWMSAHLELLTHRKDGSAFWAEWHIIPIADKAGQYSHWVVIQRDISQQKETEEALRVSKEAQKTFLEDQNTVLKEKVEERTKDLDSARLEILVKLSRAAEFRDDDTGQHTERVGHLSALLARALGLPEDDVELIRLSAPLHDIGKMGIADAILLKPEKLTPEEYTIMQAHTTIGGEILSKSQSALLQSAETIARSHHESWDGSGYPLGLHGEDIPLPGRIVTVADVFDALTHVRPYKKAWSVVDATNEIQRLQGSKFDPKVVEAFLLLPKAGAWQDTASS